MTTIAYKDGVIAYDSRSTADTLITDDDAEKSLLVNGVRFFFTGATCDRGYFLALYFGETEKHKRLEASALVVENGELFFSSVCPDEGLWKQPLKKDIAFSIGSGSNFALTAMDMGATAYQAVEMAAKRDCRTGGKIRTFTL